MCRNDSAAPRKSHFPIDYTPKYRHLVNRPTVEMSEIEYYKCPCKECGNNIEFPASAARTTVTCPHCGQWTELLVPEDEEEETEGTGLRINAGVLVGGLVLLVLVAAVGIWAWQQHQKQLVAGKDGSSPTKVAVAPIPPKLIPIKTDSPTNSEPKTNDSSVPQKPTRPKSPDDLKVTGVVELDKTKGSSLVYAIGTVRNDSDYDRYGVRVELDLFNGKGKKIGTAKDYKDYLGPRQDWQFRALIPESKTVEAKVAAITEDQ
jgi:hypothetical protein